MRYAVISEKVLAMENMPDPNQSLGRSGAMNIGEGALNVLRVRWLNAAYWVMFVLGFAWTVQLCLRSTGNILDDEIGHYLLARDAFRFPENLINVWGRPGTTLIYALPALGGLTVTRLFSVALSALVVHITSRLGALAGLRYLFLVPILLWFQPWFSELGYGVITEIPFMLWLVTGTFLWASDRYALASVFFGLLPITRHEGIGLAGIWIMFMLLQRKWKAAILAACPVLMFGLVRAAVLDNEAFAHFLRAHRTTYYGHGGWFYYVNPLIHGVGRPICILAMLGVLPLLKLNGRRRLFAGFIVYFLVHVVIYRLGLYAAGGFDLFLLPVAPALALAGAFGLELFARLTNLKYQWRRVSAVYVAPIVVWSSVFVILAVVMRRGVLTKPRPLGEEAAALKQASDWLKSHHLASRRTISTNVNFYNEFPLYVGQGSAWDEVPKLSALAIGTIVVWDRHYSDRWGLEYSQLSDRANHWRELASFGRDAARHRPKDWRPANNWDVPSSFGPDKFAIVFEKIGSEPPATPE